MLKAYASFIKIFISYFFNWKFSLDAAKQLIFFNQHTQISLSRITHLQ